MTLSNFVDKIEKKLLKRLNPKTIIKTRTNASGETTEMKIKPEEQISNTVSDMIKFLRRFIDKFKSEHDLDFVTDDIIDDNIELFVLDFEEKFMSHLAQYSKRHDDSYKLPDLVSEIARDFGKFAFNILS